jgi:hypothetical protein
MILNIYEIIVYLALTIGLVFIGSLSFYALKHYFKMKEDTRALELAKSARSKIYHVEKKLNKLAEEGPQATSGGIEGIIPDLSTITFDQALEWFGVDKKKLSGMELGIYQGIYSKFKENFKKGNNPNTEDQYTGY